jgi:hypothetical protein
LAAAKAKGRDMMKTAGLYLCLALGVLLAIWGAATPRVVPVSAPPDRFSAARAFADVTQIAKHPHPVGSADHARVQRVLLDRLEAMGLEPRLFAETAVLHRSNRFAEIAPLADIVARLPGRNPVLPAILVMSHYDTVPLSPGAADDTAGVAAMLEIARALKTGPAPERDVIFLISDGEELGLLGAEAFFKDDPLAKHVGAVVNFEARGISGQSVMYETGKNNAGMIALFAATARHPAAASLAALLYDRMPNGSDFTIPKQSGLMGLNFAFIGDELGYHTAIATPARLNLGSLQQMGDQALPVVRALAMARTLPPQTASSVFSDLFGLTLIHYPLWAGWILLALIAALIAFGPGRPLALLRAAGGSLLCVMTPVMLLWPAGKLLARIDHMQRLPHYDYAFAGTLLLAVAALALTVHGLRNGKGRIILSAVAVLAAVLCNLGGLDWAALILAAVVAGLGWATLFRPLDAALLWRGSLLLGLILGIVLQAVVPEATPHFVWPLLLASCAYAFGRTRFAQWSPALTAAVAVLATGWLGVFGNLLFLGLGIDLPAVIALPVLALLPCLMPLLAASGEEKPAVAAVLLLLGAGSFAFAGLAPPTAERPAPSIVLHVQNLDSGKAWRVAGLASLDPWSKAALSASGPIAHAPLPEMFDDPVWAAPARPAKMPRPDLKITRENGHLTIRAGAGQQVYALRLMLRSTEALTSLAIDGRPLRDVVPAGRWVLIDDYLAEGLRWELTAPAHAKIETRLRVTREGWPADAAKLPPMPNNYMPAYTSGYSQGFVSAAAAW